MRRINRSLALLLLSTGTALGCGYVPEPLLKITHAAEVAYGLPQDLLTSLVWAESRYCPTRVSSAGAQGLGQLMPGTARDMGVTQVFDPVQNIYGAARYLRLQWETFHDWTWALYAYHDGPKNARAGVISSAGQAYSVFVLGTYDAIRRQGGLQLAASR
ncbi:lytic transglycosylase domain-containing protein [Deinococcus ruber]|uniref:Transglycosylase SLT domain-containing protein n=1 Tax=Deinococcus ruber TaxID=1848197 RepID=A0A918FA30_9DEIO|nr:lytic transglycosylase domain-containing protein [Deinococcus ruber]GGR15620.1 hypothetical protein GCM10008957_30450 [Deinococcus ruber]